MNLWNHKSVKYWKRYAWCDCAIHIKEFVVSWRGFVGHSYCIQYTIIGGIEPNIKVSVATPYALNFTCITIKLFTFQVQRPLPNNQVNMSSPHFSFVPLGCPNWFVICGVMRRWHVLNWCFRINYKRKG